MPGVVPPIPSLPLRIPFHVSGLARPFAQVYFGMCAKDIVAFRELATRLDQTDDMRGEYDVLYHQVLEASVRPVVFGAMCIEAALFDLATILFGSGSAKANDRRTTPLLRFKDIAKGVKGREPPDDHPTVQAINQLFRARNRLVHYKSEPYIDVDWTKVIATLRKRHAVHMQGIATAFHAPVHLSLFLDEGIFDQLRVLPSFKKPEDWQHVVPAPLHDDVRSCIAAQSAHARV